MDDPVDPDADQLISSSDPPDVMNDPAFAPPHRRDTTSSAGGFGSETCRICRSEGTSEEPLFYPCKCSGSIKFVHQECLMEWLSHSHKKHCELCKTPFRFTKLYDANMPKKLPWAVFVRRACVHVAMLCVQVLRALLVGGVWLVILPYMIRWAWRWMFWFADAGWAREAFMRHMQADGFSDQSKVDTQVNEMSMKDSLYTAWEQVWHGQIGSAEGQHTETTVDMITGLLTNAFNSTQTNQPRNLTDVFPTDSSILSSWTYISEMTPSPQINRVILDVFEGQLITCVVITGFILVFLIREWVVQQQPLVNLDNLNNEQRERERLNRERDRLVRQAELLDQARARLATLQAEADAMGAGTAEGSTDQASFKGWEHLSSLIDAANESLRSGDADAREDFEKIVGDVLEQIRVSNSADTSAAEIAEQVYGKLSVLSDEEREAWEEILVSELKENGSAKGSSHHDLPVSAGEEAEDSTSAARRPPMPNRDSFSRATQIQRILEEADIALNTETRHPDAPPSNTNAAVDTSTESASIVSEPSTEGSWQQVNANEDAPDEIDHRDIFQDNNDEIPITNAGPDAKINIKRKGKQKSRAVVPEPKPNLLSDQELLKRLKQEGESSTQGATDNAQSPSTASATQDSRTTEQAGESPINIAEGNQDSHLHAAQQEDVAASEAIADETTDATTQTAVPDDEPNTVPADQPGPARNQPQAPPPSAWQRLADWFWGDIEAPNAPEPAIDPNEELVGDGDNAQQAPFVPVQDGQPAMEDAPQQEPEQPNDPEVAAAAQQAGLDAEAIDDAEDLEGILELIGVQGPLIGLFQTSCFCSVLVTGTVFGAVGLPYVWGKLVLSFIGAPITFLIKTPLQVASFVADLLVDLTLLIVGWLTFVVGLGIGLILSVFTNLAPSYRDSDAFQWITKFVTSTAANAGYRLQNMFITEIPAGFPVMPAWNWAFLSASVHAHTSLKNLETEINAVLNYTGHVITTFVETISSGSSDLIWERLADGVSQIPSIPVKLVAGVEALHQYTRPWLDVVGSLRNGTLVLPSEEVPLDPSLVYWSTNDRGLAVFAGYLALAAIAAIYVAVDTPITRSQSGQRTEKVVRDSLRQAGGVFKVILIISIEMLVFPLYCGLLLDMAFLPLFKSASVATRWAFAVRSPYTFCFVHWFVGTCYMFHFALFVGMCRKILRKGVLWFIRDPDDPTFHPVRDVLERNVTTQLRKIAFSALVYGALVILCLGGVIWSIGRAFNGIFPIYWISTEPILEFPLDLLLYNLVVPLSIKLFNSAKVINTMYAWWLRLCARGLRLSHFLFDDRRKDEEGTHVHKTWNSFLLLKRANPEEAMAPSDKRLIEGKDLPEVYFKRDGKYVLTPCNDAYRPPKPGEAFLYADGADVYIGNKDGEKNSHFANVYIPPFFRLRVALFMVCLWMFSAFAGLCATLLPLVFGRHILTSLLPPGVKVNDIYAYSTGAYLLGGSLYAAFKGKSALQFAKQKAEAIDVQAWIQSIKKYGTRALKCAYVYGFAAAVVPIVFALLLQFYLITPLHTYMHSSFAPLVEETVANTTGLNITMPAILDNATASFAQHANETTAVSGSASVVEHNIHALSDAALAFLFMNLGRTIVAPPGSRGAEAMRRVFSDGYFNPDVRLATRFFILPATLFSSVVLLAPLALAKALITALSFSLSAENLEGLEVLVYRFSYPMTAGLVALVVGSRALAKATGRWRGRIRDEVYLVGERLHNFGEKKPPVGSRSVVRKER